MSHISDRVTEGVIFCRNQYGQDWFNNVDLETLRMTDARNCILGQLEKHKMGAGRGFYQALNRLNLDHTRADEMGFTIETVGRDDEWGTLTDEWKRRIRNLRETFRAPVVRENVEPFVNITVTFTDDTQHEFNNVRGASFKDGTLTFEDHKDRIFYVPNVRFWFNTDIDD